jgi:glycosyltransferase involved in cell wall biosynthesis
LKAGILAYGLDRPIGGIGRYTVDLIHALSSRDRSPRLDITLLTTCSLAALPIDSCCANHRLAASHRLPGLMTWGNVALRQAAQRLDLDVIHDPTGLTPFLFGAGRARTVVTVHDVFAWSLPGHSTVADTFIYRHWLPHVLPRVDAVITISQVSRADIVQYLRIPPQRIRVVYRCVGEAYHPVSDPQIARVRKSYGLPQKYFLFVGSVEERKNLRRLLQACADLWATGEERPLVVVGARRWKYSKIMNSVRELDLERRVIFTGHVPDSDLPALYNGADLFVFPSLYEGFGLPPLEAMACGTPVVCSNASSLPEVVGDAALTVDPHDVEALSEAMHRVLSDPDLADDLRRRGLERAARFTWDQAARETIDVYREVLS